MAEIYRKYQYFKVDDNKYQTGSKRFLAAIIDSFVFVPFIFIYNWIFDQNQPQNLIIIWTIFTTLISTFYSVFLHYKYGQTIGKWAVGIKVIDISETRNISFKQSLFRDGIYILIELTTLVFIIFTVESFSEKIDRYNNFTSYAQLIWLLLELLTMFTNKKRRALHDYLANSVVIKL